MTEISLFESAEKADKSVLPPRQALAVSLLLHGLALAFLKDLPVVVSPGVAPAERLNVSVRIPYPAASLEERTKVAQIHPKTSRQRFLLPPVLAAEAKKEQGAVPSAPSLVSAPTPPVPPAQPVAPGGIPQAVAEKLPASVAVASEETQSKLNAAGLREFREALASEASRLRNYPEAARRAGIVGVSEILVSVNALGQRHTELARSSGHALLDQAALEMLRIAAERTSLPQSLQGREFAVLLPVMFEIED